MFCRSNEISEKVYAHRSNLFKNVCEKSNIYMTNCILIFYIKRNGENNSLNLVLIAVVPKSDC